MGTAALISLDEYLNTSYRPDVDFLEGELEERNMGEGPHSDIQGFLLAFFHQRKSLWAVHPRPEQRVQVTPTRFRVPDVCILRATDPRDAIVTVPPLLCIEVLSSADTLRKLQARVDDYFRMGVEHVWAIDPWQRRAYSCSPSGFVQPQEDVLRIEGTPIAVKLEEVFAELDPA